MTQQEINELLAVLTASQNILVIIPPKHDYDATAAACALYLSLTKAGKNVVLYCEKEMLVEENDLVGVDKVKNQLEGQNLMVSLDYTEDAIEKVSYNVEGKKFNLIVQPKPGAKPLDPQTVQYSYSGLDCDLIFLINPPDFESLGKIYVNEKNLFQSKPMVLLSYHESDIPEAKYRVGAPKSSSVCELATQIIQVMKMVLDKDIASNLASGINFATDNLQKEKLSADSYTAVGICIRAGAENIRRKTDGVKSVKEVSVMNKVKKSEEKVPTDWLTAPKVYRGSANV